MPHSYHQALDPHQAAALLLVMLGELPKALLPNMAIVLIEAAIEAGQVRPADYLQASCLNGQDGRYIWRGRSLLRCNPS